MIIDQKTKKLWLGKCKLSGRSKGRISTYHRGGSNKRTFRILNFCMALWNVWGIVLSLEYDPNRTARIILIQSSNNCLIYQPAPEGVILYQIICYGNLEKFISKQSLCCTGHITYLRNIKPGEYVSNLLFLGKNTSNFARTAHFKIRLFSQYYNRNVCIIKFLQKNIKQTISCWTIASIGCIQGKSREYRYCGKAGLKRHYGRRPVVRGVAMNPIDHPHGGGQGKTSGGRPSVTPWGLITKGRKTKKKN